MARISAILVASGASISDLVVIMDNNTPDENSTPIRSLRDVDFNTVHTIPSPKADNWKDRKSKGEKKRQRSEWNRSMRK